MNWWKKLKAWLAKWTKKAEPKPMPKPDPIPEPKPEPTQTHNDAPGVELSVRCAGNEIVNDGRATYLGGVLTTRPADGWRNVCVQHNDLQKGEITDWKDTANKLERTDVIKNTNKFVCWYER